jgi:hypothetical protein
MKIRIASNSIKNNELWYKDADLSVGKITYLLAVCLSSKNSSTKSTFASSSIVISDFPNGTIALVSPKKSSPFSIPSSSG